MNRDCTNPNQGCHTHVHTINTKIHLHSELLVTCARVCMQRQSKTIRQYSQCIFPLCRFWILDPYFPSTHCHFATFLQWCVRKYMSPIRTLSQQCPIKPPSFRIDQKTIFHPPSRPHLSVLAAIQSAAQKCC